MEEKGDEILTTLWSITGATEFWAAIAGAVLGAVAGGLIALMIQMKALREGRRLRDEDHKLTREALGNSLLIKVMRVHSNFYILHRHIEDSLAKAAQSGFKGDPWQFVVPLVNPPDPVHFSSEEMGMLLGLKVYDVFNLVLPLGDIHNGLNDSVRVLNTERMALTERITADEAKGVVLSSNPDKGQRLALRPRMIGVNTLIEQIRVDVKRALDQSDQALNRLHKLLQDELGVAYKLESNVKPEDPQAPDRSDGVSNPPG